VKFHLVDPDSQSSPPPPPSLGSQQPQPKAAGTHEFVLIILCNPIDFLFPLKINKNDPDFFLDWWRSLQPHPEAEGTHEFVLTVFVLINDPSQ
jgi:hypothetical protein